MDTNKQVYVLNGVQYDKKSVAMRIKEVNDMVKKDNFEKRINRVLRVISSYSVQYNLKICDINEHDTSKTNGKTIWLTLPLEFIFLSKNKIYSAFVALAMHEMEHILSTNKDIAKQYREDVYQDIFYKLGKNQSDHISHYIFNAVCDGRIERRAANRTKGYAKILKWFRFLFYYNRCIEEPSDNDDIYSKQLSDVLWAVCTIATFGKFPRNWEKFYDDNSEETILINNCIPYIEKAVASDMCQECADNCKEICYILKDYIISRLPTIPEDLLKLLEDIMSSAEINFGPSSVVIEDGKAIDGNISIRENSNDDKSDNDKSIQKQREIIEKDIESFGENELDKRLKEDEKKNDESQNFKPNSNDLAKLGETDINYLNYDIVYENYNHVKCVVAPHLQDIGKKLNKNLKPIFISQKKAYSYNRKKGLIDQNNLSKLSTKEPNIFKKKNKISTPEVAIYSLIDASGSMSGKKWKSAMDTSSIIEIGLKDLVPLKIATFNTSSYDTQIDVIKDFKDYRYDNFTQNYRLKHNPSGCNRDGLAIRIACSELMKRPEKTKILIVTCDGMPSAYCASYENGEEDVHNAIKEASKNGITTFGIYIGKDKNAAFARMYGEQRTIFCTPEELSSIIPRIIKNNIKRF